MKATLRHITCVGQLICPEERVSSLNKSNPSIHPSICQFKCPLAWIKLSWVTPCSDFVFSRGGANLDLTKHDKHPPTEKCLDIMYANHLIPVINRPTRVTMNTCTLIDNIFTNQYDARENQLHGILKTDITDHFPLFYINCRKSPSSSDDDYKLIRIMNGVRTTQYVSKIQNMDWSFLDSFTDCQSYFSNFIKVL